MLTIWTIALILAVAALGVALVRERTHARRREEQLRRTAAERRAMFDLMHDLGEMFTADLRTGDLLQVVADSCLRVTHARGAAIYLLNEAGTRFEAKAVAGVFPPLTSVPPELQTKLSAKPDHITEHVLHDPLSVQGGLAGATLQSGTLLVPDTTGDARFPAVTDKTLRIQSFAATALHYREETLGLLALSNRSDGEAFTAEDLDLLQSVGNQTAFALHNARVLIDLADKQRMDRDVEVARDIQNVLLPSTCPPLPGFEIQACNVAAQEVSGDYFDFIELDGGRWGLAIADVSGKGVPASLIMAMCRCVLRSVAPGKTSAAETLRDLNRRLYPDIREDMFITMVYAILDPATHTLVLARAGHERPLVFRGGAVETIDSKGMPLGIDSGDVFDTVIHDVSVTLGAGDSLILFTDGVTETLDEEGREFGKDNFSEAIRVSAPEGADAVIKNVLERLTRFRGDGPPHDDVTLITLYAGN